jgi:tetratricopeptide (TPR) repeat protein
MLWYQFRPYEAYLAVGRFEDVSTLTGAVLSNSGGLDVEETYYYQGQMRQLMGNVEGAVTSYREALRLNPNYNAAQVALEAVE